MVKYEYDAWGEHSSYMFDDPTGVGSINPFRYRSYFYNEDSGYYFLGSRVYDPLIGRFLSPDSVEYADPAKVDGLNLYAYCHNNPVMGYDPTGNWDWGTFWRGVGMAVTAVAAIALSVATFGAGIPLAMTLVAGVTLTAGILTGINSIATMVEAGTDYNFVRDGVFQGNEEAYDIYANVTETVAAVGSMVLGGYHTTGQYKAAKYGQKFLGKGYDKVAKNRWVSNDGLRQMRLDTSHLFKGEKIPNHINLEYFKVNYWNNARAPINHKKGQHLIYTFFSFIIR